jgi:hypothetical protein
MKELVTVLILWLSSNFDLPHTPEHPRIEFAYPGYIAQLRYGGGDMKTVAADLPARPDQRDVIAVYEDRSRTIVLPHTWTGKSPADVSILVHELVHHLQATGRLGHACPQERERLAFQAQNRWLQLFGSSLEREFNVDPFTVIAASACDR